MFRKLLLIALLGGSLAACDHFDHDRRDGLDNGRASSHDDGRGGHDGGDHDQGPH